MTNQNKALLVAVICLVAFLIVGVFLVFNFQDIEREGIACMSDPLVWAEKRLYEDQDIEYNCQCQEANRGDIYMPVRY